MKGIFLPLKVAHFFLWTSTGCAQSTEEGRIMSSIMSKSLVDAYHTLCCTKPILLCSPSYIQKKPTYIFIYFLILINLFREKHFKCKIKAINKCKIAIRVLLISHRLTIDAGAHDAIFVGQLSRCVCGVIFVIEQYENSFILSD